jgi:hypothetical protein
MITASIKDGIKNMMIREVRRIISKKTGARNNRNL